MTAEISDDTGFEEALTNCKHKNTDSITVCDECEITLRMVRALRNFGFIKWGDVENGYRTGELFEIKGIGIVSTLKLMDVQIYK